MTPSVSLWMDTNNIVRVESGTKNVLVGSNAHYICRFLPLHCHGIACHSFCHPFTLERFSRHVGRSISYSLCQHRPSSALSRTAPLKDGLAREIYLPQWPQRSRRQPLLRHLARKHVGAHERHFFISPLSDRPVTSGSDPHLVHAHGEPNCRPWWSCDQTRARSATRVSTTPTFGVDQRACTSRSRTRVASETCLPRGPTSTTAASPSSPMVRRPAYLLHALIPASRRLAHPRPRRSRCQRPADQHRKTVRVSVASHTCGTRPFFFFFQRSLHCWRGHQAHLDRTSAFVDVVVM